MNLIWHIVKKDARRLWLPLALWGATLLADTVVKALLISGETANGWGYTVAGFTPIIGWLLTAVLAAKLVLEDPLTTTTVFWRTRPISNRQLLVAKALELSGLILGPLAFYLVLLIFSGIGGRELASAAADEVLWRAVVVLGAAALAGVTDSFGAFIVRALAVIIGTALVAGMVGSSLLLHRILSQTIPSESLADSRALAARVLAVAIGGSLLAWRYFTRRDRSAVAGVYAGALVVMLTSSVWPWDYLGQIRFAKTNSAEGKTVSFNFSSPVLRASPTSEISGEIEAQLLSRGEVLIPQRLYSVDVQDREQRHMDTKIFIEHSRKSGSLGSLEPTALAVSLAPLRLLNAPTKRALSIELFGLQELPPRSQQPLHLQAQLAASRAQFVIEAELPAIAGASIHHGRLQIQIEGVFTDENKINVSVREREFRPRLLGEVSTRFYFNPLQPGRVSWPPSYVDDAIYLLANRARGEALLIDQPFSFSQSSIGDLRTARGTLSIVVAPGRNTLNATWLAEATLIRVRLVGLAPLTCTLDATGLTIKNMF